MGEFNQCKGLCSNQYVCLLSFPRYTSQALNQWNLWHIYMYRILSQRRQSGEIKSKLSFYLLILLNHKLLASLSKHHSFLILFLPAVRTALVIQIPKIEMIQAQLGLLVTTCRSLVVLSLLERLMNPSYLCGIHWKSPEFMYSVLLLIHFANNKSYVYDQKFGVRT